MADWYGTSRSNYFRVKDVKAFTEAMRGLDLRVVEGDGKTAGMVAVISESENGDWPSSVWNEAADDYVEVDVVELIVPHLVGGEVCVLRSAGAEASRYVTGDACAFTNQGAESLVRVSLDDIYAKAQDAFGAEPTRAEY